jgi:hypothetical protein
MAINLGIMIMTLTVIVTFGEERGLDAPPEYARSLLADN